MLTWCTLFILLLAVFTPVSALCSHDICAWQNLALLCCCSILQSQQWYCFPCCGCCYLATVELPVTVLTAKFMQLFFFFFINYVRQWHLLFGKHLSTFHNDTRQVVCTRAQNKLAWEMQRHGANFALLKSNQLLSNSHRKVEALKTINFQNTIFYLIYGFSFSDLFNTIKHQATCLHLVYNQKLHVEEGFTRASIYI